MEVYNLKEKQKKVMKSLLTLAITAGSRDEKWFPAEVPARGLRLGAA